MIPLVLFSFVLLPCIIHAFVTSKKYSRYIAFFMISMATNNLFRKLYCLTFGFVLTVLHLVFYVAFPYDRGIIYSTALIIVFAFPKRTDKIFNLINVDKDGWHKIMGVLILSFLMFAAYFLLAESLCLVISLYIILLASYYYPSTKTIIEINERVDLFIRGESVCCCMSKMSIDNFVEQRKQDETLCGYYIPPYPFKLNSNGNMSYFSTFFLPFWDPDYALFKCSYNILYKMPIFKLRFTLDLHEYLSSVNVSKT